MITQLLLPFALAFIMFSLGLTLIPADFGRVLVRPRAVAFGLFGQMLLLPALAWGVAVIWQLPPTMAVGLVLLAACPGGVSSGLITHLARGETALSITLTAITSLAAVFSVPFILDLAMDRFLGKSVAVDLPVADIVRGIFFLTTVPVALGMVGRRYASTLAARVEGPMGRISTLFFILIVIATFAAQRQAIGEHIAAVGPAALVLNVAVMACAFGGGILLGLSRRDRVAIATECGLQNAALGIFIATSVLAMPTMAAPSVVYALLMNGVAMVFVVAMRRQGGGAQAENSVSP